MVITLTDEGTKKGVSDDKKMYFPVVPEKISYKTGAVFEEYDILNKGPVRIPSGRDITTIGWECFFPGIKLNKMNLKFISDSKIQKGNEKKNSEKTKIQLHNQLESWRNKGTKLKLNITGSPFSFYVYIEKYDVTMQDAFGTLYYSIEFSKVVEISVDKEKAKKKKNKAGGKRPSKNDTKKKYTVKKGDCLWNIAKRFYKDGTKWKKIYKENKSTIEKAAKKHGKKSSNNGWWIYPGTVLKIP